MEPELAPCSAKRRRTSIEYDCTDTDINFSSEVISINSESGESSEELSNDSKDADMTEPTTEHKEDPSLWTTTCKLKEIEFLKKSEYFGWPGQSPIEFFNILFDDNFLWMICEKTNEKVARQLGGHRKFWKPLNIKEFRTFLGLLFHMGTIQLPKIQDYWSINRLFSIPIFIKHMSRTRFLAIMRSLYFTTAIQNKDDPHYEISTITDFFNDKMAKCYYPGNELSVDKSMVLFRGHLLYGEHIKNKRHNNGIKLYTLTESNGLILKVQLYSEGQDTELKGIGHVENIVLSLLEGKLNIGHAIYMNHYYNSVGLAKQLLEKNTYCTGILRSNLKDNPKEVVDKTLTEGNSISQFQDGVHVGKWKDKRTVMFITTQYKDRYVKVLNPQGQICEKPEAIVKYNQFMSGFNKQDWAACYPCERITLWRYLKLAIHIFQLMFINSHKLYNLFSGQPEITFYEYRLSVISALLPEVYGLPAICQGKVHKLTKITERNAQNKTKLKCCQECRKSKIRQRTIWHCEACVPSAGLCVECFDDFHGGLYTKVT